MAAPKKETVDANTLTTDEMSPITVKLIGSTANVTFHLGNRSHVDFVKGEATVHPSIAKTLRDLGHVE